MGAYAKRDATLLTLGFGSYASYLDSELWKSIRAKVLIRDKRRCRCCLEPAFQVHHDSYGESTLKGDSFDRLFSICESCHRKLEFEPSGRKRLFNEVRRELVKMLADCQAELKSLIQRKSKRSKAQSKKAKFQAKRRRLTAELVAELAALPPSQRGKRIAEIPKFLRADIKHRLAAATIRRDGNGRRIQEPTAKQPERLTVSAKIRRTKRQHDPAALQGVHVQRTTQPSNPLARFVRKQQTSAQL